MFFVPNPNQTKPPDTLSDRTKQTETVRAHYILTYGFKVTHGGHCERIEADVIFYVLDFAFCFDRPPRTWLVRKR
jgi:hypothetical protein